jgi:VWFA-related protein
VAVVDQQHRFVGDLQLDDFGVYEEGRRQSVTVFVSTAAPVDVMVLLDTSASMIGRMALVQDAAIRLVRTLRSGDRAAVVLFSDSVHVAQPLTSDLRALETAVHDARPRGSTALFDALYITQRELTRTRQVNSEPRRQAVVVLTDGDDTASHVSFDDVHEESRSSAVTIFTIVPAPVQEPAFPALRDQRVVFNMRQLAEETGGRAFAPAGPADLQAVFEDIAGELSQQYWLAYTRPPDAPAGFRRVSVRVETRPGLRARTRSGFYASRPLAAAPASRRTAP